ncbi:MAG: hypothetical protein DRZ79_03500 [Candidatus Cloacimonadota bacterium]|nr:MAG: hypothetical protein DRZ79_03500 [Candidatus Cloacimonadota bacterium]
MRKILFFLTILMFLTNLYGENVQDKLLSFADENGKGYIKPLVTSFGTNINSGLFNTAKVLKPFKFGILFNGTLAFIPSEEKTFVAKRPQLYDASGTPLYEEEELESATVYGKEGAVFHVNSDLPDEIKNELKDLKLPNGASHTTNIPFVPLVIPQINLGLPYGNEIMFRMMPSFEMSEKIGAISFWGISLKHSIDQYLPGIIPIDLAVQTAYQSMKLSDIMTFNNFAANAEISKKLQSLTIYAGLGYENSKLNAKYESELTYVNENNDVVTEPLQMDFDVEGDNNFRATFGFRISVLLLKLYADYSVCKYPVANFGFGLSF